MAPDTDSAKADPPGRASRWSGGLPLAARILAVNTLPLALLAGSFFYIDGFRDRLVAERLKQAESEARLIAAMLTGTDRARWPTLIDRLDEYEKVRIRLIDRTGKVISDSWADGRQSFVLRDPAKEKWQRQVARRIDEAVDAIVGATVPPMLMEYEGKLPLIKARTVLTLAPDRTHMIEARSPIAGGSYSVVTLRNARDIRRLVRSERSQLGLMLAMATFASILLSLFLARTIVSPLKKIAEAARLVRFGQAREVQVPRLPDRGDEIGGLARSISDMSQALRQRMDATEAFAADVAHELKNPIASLSSAVESLRKVEKPELRSQLQNVISDDVRRLDRLITDIADLSRVDAHIARTRFERVDLAAMIDRLIAEREARASKKTVKTIFGRPQRGSTIVNGDPDHLARLLGNLLDNAVSFSPPDGVIRVAATRAGGRIVLTVDDDGPGVPEALREAVFERFHSDRPETEFGKHSGLGLAIARSIVEAHEGSIRVEGREKGKSGSRFVVELPPALA